LLRWLLCIGDLNETELSLGIVKEISFRSFTRIKPLLGVDVSYASSKYSGEFSGGFGGQGYIFDNSFNKFGVAGDLGISFEPYRNLIISAITSLRFSKIKEERKLEDMKTNGTSLKFIPIEVFPGVNF
jgi:opacity protein-like surface antigen